MIPCALGLLHYNKIIVAALKLHSTTRAPLHCLEENFNYDSECITPQGGSCLSCVRSSQYFPTADGSLLSSAEKPSDTNLGEDRSLNSHLCSNSVYFL